MKKILIDLNIILDMLNKRVDHEAAVILFDLCVKKVVQGYISSHELTTLAYFLEKQKYSTAKRKKVLISLLSNLTVLAADERILRTALDSEIQDYEDAVIDELAYANEIDCIVTRDLKDFKKSKNTVYTAVEAIDFIQADSADPA